MSDDLKTKVSDDSVQDFIDQVENEGKRADCHTIDKMFEKITGQPGKMWGKSIVGYGTYSYTRSDGKFYDFMATGFSPRAANITIYNIPGYEGLPDLMTRLGKYSTGKSCLYIKNLSDIDVAILEIILTSGYNSIAGKHLDYKTKTWTNT